MQNGRERHGKWGVLVDVGFGMDDGGGGGVKIIDLLYNLRSTVPLYHGERGGQESKVFLKFLRPYAHFLQNVHIESRNSQNYI